MAEKDFDKSKQLMQLSRNILATLDPAIAPDASLFVLPEKVLQFGTGVFLRGLPDYIIDKANKQHIFNGRIAVIKSTSNGGTDAFKQQDGMYTHLERGIENGNSVERITINASISRVLSASEEWDAILACAANPALQVVISNTTEVGIALVEDDAYSDTPVSFPGRLLSILQHRYQTFNGSEESGLVIIPTELLVDNGRVLQDIVTTLAKLRGLDDAFLEWLQSANDFCNSLVDRIVPGKLSKAEYTVMEKQLDYTDDLMIMSETYRLWAIETSRQKTKDALSFYQADEGVVITHDINKFRELKLRLLNGAHTFSCGLACLSGFGTVKEAMSDKDFSVFLQNLMLQEIAPLIAHDTIIIEEANDFTAQVLDRFRNPFIEHQWLNITVQYTSKMMTRTVPLIEKHYSINTDPPELMALGFAAWLLFTKPIEKSGEAWYGIYQGKRYPIPDDKAELLYRHWQSSKLETIVDNVLSDATVFGKDLTVFKGFTESIQMYLASLIQQGVAQTLHSGIIKQTMA